MQTRAQAPTQEMENILFPCTCICAAIFILHVWTGVTQTQDEKYSFHASMVYVQTKMASSSAIFNLVPRVLLPTAGLG